MKKVSQISMKALGYTPKEVRSLVEVKTKLFFLDVLAVLPLKRFMVRENMDNGTALKALLLA